MDFRSLFLIAKRPLMLWSRGFSMSATPLEQRIETLEKQMQIVLRKMHSSSGRISETKDWRKSLGMFDDHPVMQQIDEAGQLVRQQDCEQGAA